MTIIPSEAELQSLPIEKKVECTIEVVEEQLSRFSDKLTGNIHHDDLRSAGQIALWRAHRDFTHGNIHSEIRCRVRWAMTDEWRRQTLSRRKGERPRFSEIQEDLMDEAMGDPFLREELEYKISKLKHGQKMVIGKMYFMDKSASDIAKSWGLTSGRIFQIHQQALAKLRRLVAA